MMQNLILKSPAFIQGGWIPPAYSAWGENLSPQLELQAISEKAESIAITMDDASHPIFPNYNHWLIWNIPVLQIIPRAVPKGKCVTSLSGAMQGLVNGRHCYKGPKPPFRAIHEYTFTAYVLDCKLSLPANSRRKDFLKAVEAHVLQKATLTGKFQNRGK